MGVCDTWNVDINILACENEFFLLPAEFYFNNSNKIYLPKVQFQFLWSFEWTSSYHICMVAH